MEIFMKLNIILGVLAILLLAAQVSAAHPGHGQLNPEFHDLNETEMTEADRICDYMLTNTTLKNQANMPDFIPFRDETFNFHVDDELIGSLSVNEGVIHSVECKKEAKEPTYIVHIDSLGTVTDIFEANSSIDAYNQKRSSKELVIEGVGFGKKVKLFFANIGTTIAGWFA